MSFCNFREIIHQFEPLCEGVLRESEEEKTMPRERERENRNIKRELKSVNFGGSSAILYGIAREIRYLGGDS